MSSDAKFDIISNALCSLGMLLPGELLSVDETRYLEAELDAILASLHLILAERIAKTGVTIAGGRST